MLSSGKGEVPHNMLHVYIVVVRQVGAIICFCMCS